MSPIEYKKWFSRPGRIAVIICTLAGLAIFYLNYISYYSFSHLWSWDLAVVNQLSWNLLNGNGLECGVIYQSNFLGHHFEPIYFLTLPFYAICPNAFCFQILGVVAFFAVFVAVYKISTHFLFSPYQTLMLAVFFIHPATIPMIMDFNGRDSMFATAFLSLALWFFIKRNYLWWVLTAILASMCVEYISLIIAGFILPCLVQRRGFKWWVFALIFGVGYFLIVTTVAMPLINGGNRIAGQKFDSYSYLGASFAEIIKTLVFNPGILISNITNTLHWHNSLLLFLPFMFYPLLGLEYFFIPFSQYLLVLAYPGEDYTNPGLWYITPTLPFIFTACIIGVKRALPYLKNRKFKSGMVAAHIVVLLFIFNLNVKNINRRLPVMGSFNQDLSSFIKDLDKNDAVSAQAPFIAMASSRKNIRLYPDMEACDWVILGSKRKLYPFTNKKKYLQTLNKVLKQGDYGIYKIYPNGDIILKK